MTAERTAGGRAPGRARPRRADCARAAAYRPSLPSIATVAFLVLVVLGPLFALEGQEKGLTGEGNALRQIGYATVFLLAIASTWLAKRPGRYIPMPLSLVVALAWCWVSLAWAIEPEVALRRLILTTMVTWTIFLMVGQLGYQVTVRWLRLMLVASLIANYVAVIGSPMVGIHQLDLTGDPGLVGDWRGFTPHKNFAGQLSAYAIILFTLDTNNVNAWLRRCVTLGATYFLYRSGSKTSAGVLCLAWAAAWVYRHYTARHRALLVPVLLLALVMLAIGGYAYAGTVATMLDSPDALTGRVQIWPVMVAYSRDHLMGGTGYGSFWNIGTASPVYLYSSGWTTELTTAHNGYLDMLAQIGLPGLLLVTIATIIVPLTKLLKSRTASRQQGAVLIAMIVFGAAHNLTESTLFDRDSLVHVFLMFAIALIVPVVGRQGCHPLPAGNGGRG